MVENARYLFWAELGSGLAEGPEGLNNPLGEQLLLVVAADLRLAAQVPVVLPVVEEELVESADVARARVAGICSARPLDVGDHAHHLLADDLGIVRHPDDVADGLRHPLLAVGAFDERCLGKQCTGLRKHRRVDAIEPARDFADELHVSLLILADWDTDALDDQDVRTLEDRVGQQPEIYVVRAQLRLFFEGRCAHDPAQWRDHRKHERQLRDLRDLRLKIKDAALGIDPDRQQVCREVEHLAFDGATVRFGGKGVVVGNEVVAVVLVLQADPVFPGAEIVAKVKAPCRAHAAEDPHPLCHRVWSLAGVARAAGFTPAATLSFLPPSAARSSFSKSNPGEGEQALWRSQTADERKPLRFPLIPRRHSRDQSLEFDPPCQSEPAIPERPRSSKRCITASSTPTTISIPSMFCTTTKPPSARCWPTRSQPVSARGRFSSSRRVRCSCGSRSTSSGSCVTGTRSRSSS